LDLFAGASFHTDSFCSVANLAELVAQEGVERLKLRDRRVEQLPG
jgi:hypothetical protein